MRSLHDRARRSLPALSAPPYLDKFVAPNPQFAESLNVVTTSKNRTADRRIGACYFLGNFGVIFLVGPVLES